MENKVYILDVINAKNDKTNIANYLTEGKLLNRELTPSVCMIETYNQETNSVSFEIVPWSDSNFKFLPNRVAVRNLNEATEFIKNL